MTPSSFDIVINGGGLIGSSAALALTERGFRVALIEKHPFCNAQHLKKGWDSRIFAISPINQRFLRSLKVWPKPQRVGIIQAMHIMADQGGQLDLKSQEADLEALAWVVEQCQLLSLLWQALHASSITLLTHTEPTAYHTTLNHGRVTLDQGQVLKTKLLVGADGAQSWVRKQSALPFQMSPYQQSAVVANFACSMPHQAIARQWFFGPHVLAWLPLPGQRFSMVWSTPSPQALLSLSSSTLATTVAQAGKYQLGTLTTLTPAQVFPLRALKLVSTVAYRMALIGDAAHLIHPLAGQGVNIGFRDVQQLVSHLSGATDPGNLELLRHFSNSRLIPVKAVHYTCDGLSRLFSTSDSVWANLGNKAFNSLNHSSFLKRQLIQLATYF